MAVFDNVIEDVAGRFGLGGKAGPLLHEVVQLMTIRWNEYLSE